MKWYNIQNSINNLSISIDEEIGSFGVNAKDFIEEVQSNGSKNIELTINSGGGSVFEAFAIYDYLKTSNLNVSVKIVGVAASAASVLALAGDTLPTMTENSVIMIHNAWMPVISMQGMNSDEIRDYQEELEKDAKLMDSLNLKIAKIYSNATGLDLERVQEMMKAETWIFSEEAKELGFVSEVKEGKKIAAFASEKDLAKMGYKNTPSNYVNQLNNVNMSENKDGLLDQLKAYVSDLLAPKAEAVEETVEETVEAVEETTEEVTEEVEEATEEVTNEPQDSVDVEAIKSELMASIKAELTAKDDELAKMQKELDKAKASRKPLEAKEDSVNPEAKIEEADELGAAILNILKSSYKA
jgi:ATP-dependent protease ClpP protease subunit